MPRVHAKQAEAPVGRPHPDIFMSAVTEIAKSAIIFCACASYIIHTDFIEISIEAGTLFCGNGDCNAMCQQ